DTCHAGAGGGQASAALAALKGTTLSGKGAGCYVLASAGPNDRAYDGVFVDTFLNVIADKSLFGPGSTEYPYPEEILVAVNQRFMDHNPGQEARGDTIGTGAAPQRFIRNPAYAPQMAGQTVEDIQHWDVKSRGS